MRTLELNSFNELVKVANIKPRLRTELKFIRSTESLREDWSIYEMLAVSNRAGDQGVLLLEPENELYIVQYELSQKASDPVTGRSRAIICDFCYTWQPGSNAGSITFSFAKSTRKVRFLCCGDLKCSEHVRSSTKEAIVSRTQLRENMTNEDRVRRLQYRLSEKIAQLGITKVS